MLSDRVIPVALFALLLLSGAPSPAAEEGATLAINVRGAKPGKGQAICSLFTSPENYLRQPVRSRTKPVDANGEAVCRFDQLAAGTYAVSVVYDEDLDGKLGTGLLGIPTELVGMSNNAKGVFGPPSFEKSAFPLSQSLSIDILLGEAKD